MRVFAGVEGLLGPLRGGAGRAAMAGLVAATLLALRPTPVDAASAPPAPSAVRGQLDLSGWSPSSDGPVLLKGEWGFFPGSLLDYEAAVSRAPPGYRSVPDQWTVADAGGTWGRGSGTYRLTLLLPAEARGLGIRYTTLSTAFELDVAGETIARAGKPAATKSDALAAYAPGVAEIPDDMAAPAVGSRKLELVVRVSNHEYRVGGMWRSFELGNAAALATARGARVERSLVLSAAIAAIVLVFLFFFRNRRKDGSFFIFAMFSLSVSLRTLVTGEYALAYLFPGLPFGLLIRLEYLSAFSPLPLAVLFYRAIFPDEIGRKLSIALAAPNLPFIAAIPFAPLPVLTRTIQPYYAVALPLIAATLALGPIRAAFRGRDGGIAIAAGSLALAASAINDILFSSFIIFTDNLFPVGLLAFVVAQASVLASRYNTAFAKVEALSSDLSTANERLVLEVDKYKRSQSELESLLGEKDMLLKEVHHRVKNSLQIVSSIIGLQSHATTDPAAAAAYDAMRSRIRAVSLVHEKLYGLDSAEEDIDLEAYVRDLAQQISASYGRGSSSGFLTSAVERLKVPADFCIDCGLILTEVVSNACRHGTAVAEPGSIRIEASRSGPDLVIRVSDQGPGFPAGFDPAAVKSLGFRVISGLVAKRAGALSISPGPSPVVTIRLPLPMQAAAGAARIEKGASE